MELNLKQKKVPSQENLQKIINLMISFKSTADSALEKCIVPWVENEVYQKDSLVTYNNYIWQAAITNQSATFNENNWIKLSDSFEEIDVDTVKSMIGLSEEEIQGLNQIIDDTQIVLNKTYSSSKIYSDIAQCLEDSKTYTLTELAKAVGASYKVVTDTSSMTDSKVLYLMKDVTSGTYGIYVYDEDTATAELIGDFSINLDDYVSKDEVEDLPFVKCYSSIESLGVTTPCNISAVFNSMRDGSVLECSVTTSKITNIPEDGMIAMHKPITGSNYAILINSSNTNTYIGKYYGGGVFDWLQLNNNFKMVTDVEELGLTLPCNFIDVYNAIGANQMFTGYYNKNDLVGIPIGGSVFIVGTGYEEKIAFVQTTNLVYMGNYRPGSVSWIQLLTTDGITSVIKTNVINEFFKKGGTNIPTGADLDTYTTEGIYRTSSTEIAETILNSPVKRAFRLIVTCGHTDIDNGNYPTIQQRIVFANSRSNPTEYMRINSEGIWGVWKRYCVTTVEDIPVTDVALESAKVELSGSDSIFKYTVVNGVCTLSIFGLLVRDSCAYEILASGLPKPLFTMKEDLSTYVNGVAGLLWVDTTGTLRLNIGAPSTSDGMNGYASFSYPVAES